MLSFGLISSESASPAVHRSLLRSLKPRLCVTRPLNIVNGPLFSKQTLSWFEERRGPRQRERAGVQCCVWSSRWQFVSLFLLERRREALQWGRKEWLQCIKKKRPLNRSPQRSRNTGVVKIKGLLQGRLSKPEWLRQNKTKKKQQKKQYECECVCVCVCVREFFQWGGISERQR